MQPDIATILQDIFSRSWASFGPGSIAFHPVGGGSINFSYRVSTPDKQQWFCKINDAEHYPGLFETERDGLNLLHAAGIFRTPAVAACDTVGKWQVLVLEWISPHSPSPSMQDKGAIGTMPAKQPFPQKRPDWHLFGQQLAALHHVKGPYFGLERNNYIGSLEQSNNPSPDWVNFFTHQRLAPLIKMATARGLLEASANRHFERLFLRLHDIFGDSTASLLHGDLWSGNVLFDQQGAPVLIDPAVYYGDANMDLAMTTLFGGFEQAFYESYAYHYPLAANYREQWDICNLYPLLVHLNLFGKSYLGTILDTIQQF